MPPTERQLAANRANALKSSGPVTPEGKARAAANARVTHGLASPERAALSAVLRNEDRETFLTFHLALHAEHQPDSPTEEIIVREMAVADWRLNRARAMETALLDNQMDLMAPGLATACQSIDHATRAALAFKESADKSNALALLLRYTGRLEREASRTRHELTNYRSAQQRYEQLAQKAQEPGEANPEIEHLLPEEEQSARHDEQRHQQQLPTGDAALPAAQYLPRANDAGHTPGLAPAASPPAMECVSEAPERNAPPDAGRTPWPLPRAA